MTNPEPTTIGLSKSAHQKLKELQELQYFRDLLDGYRFAIGMALAQGIDPPDISDRTTMFNIGTFDPDQSLKYSIQAVMGDRVKEQPIYKIAERLAEWGVNEMSRLSDESKLNLVELLEQAEGTSDQA
jgi:hypothetical protein